MYIKNRVNKNKRIHSSITILTFWSMDNNDYSMQIDVHLLKKKTTFKKIN